MSIDVFLIFECRRPSLSASGKTPSCSEELSVVITGSSSLRQDFRVLVGIGSEGHDLEGELSITVRTVSIVTSLNSEKKTGAGFGVNLGLTRRRAFSMVFS